MAELLSMLSGNKHIFCLGDVMGCGILFPRDYNAEHDSDGTKDSSDVSEGEEVEDYIEVEDYNSDASDDEMWFDRANQAEKGTKIDVSKNSTPT